MILRTLAVLVALLGAPLPAGAATLPFAYGGRLVTADGQPVAGPVALRIAFHSQDSGGAALATVTSGLESVALREGVFSVDVALTEADWANVFADPAQPVWIEITDLTHAPDAPLPRQRFSFVPFALKTPVDPRMFRYDADGHLTLKPTTGPAANQFLTLDGGGNLAWGTAATNPGTVTGVTAGTGLTGGTITGAGTLGVDVGTTAGKIVQMQAGDKLPAVDGSALTGVKAAALRNVDLGATAPSDGQVLKYDLATNTWIPGNDQLGASGTGIQQLGGLGATAQSLAVGTSGNAPSWTSAVDTHTLNIPMASAGGTVTAGLLSNAEFQTFTNKVAKAGDTMTGTLVINSGAAAALDLRAAKELRFSPNAGVDWIALKPAAGTTGAVTLTLPATAGAAGQFLQTNGSGVLSWQGLSTADVPSAIPASKLGAGSVDDTELGYLNGVTSGVQTQLDGKAAAGANADITSLSGLTTALSVAQGGTGGNTQVTARTGLGLGSSATLDVGTAAGTVAAGDHTHANATTGAAGFMSGADKTALNGLSTSALVDGDFGANGLMRRTAAGVYDTVTDDTTNWNTAYTERAQWDGGGTNLVAATGRASLGLGSLATKSSISDGDVAAGAAIANSKIAGLNVANWDSAYTDRLKWDGGGTGLDAATGRTSLGLGTAATLNAGTGASNVVQLDGSGNLPALNGAALTALNAANLGSGTVPDARLSANVALFGSAVDTAELANGAVVASKVDPTQVMTATTADLTLYVDPLGNDTGACAAAGASACQTLTGVMAKIPRMVNHNVTVNVKNATYNEEVYIDRFSIKASKVVLLQGNGGTFVVSGGGTRSYGLIITDISGSGAIRIKDARATAATGAGVGVARARNLIYLENVSTDTNTGDGISTWYANVTLEGTIVASSNTGSGIVCQYTSNCTQSTGSLTASSNGNFGIYTSHHSLFANSTGVVNVNSNAKGGAMFTDFSNATISWPASGGSQIRFGYDNATKNGTALSDVGITVANHSRFALAGKDSANRAIVRSAGIGIYARDESAANLTYLTADSNGSTGVACTSLTQCTLNTFSANSNGGPGMSVAGKSFAYTAGTWTLDSNANAGFACYDNTEVNFNGTGYARNNTGSWAVGIGAWTGCYLNQGAAVTVTGNGVASAGHGIYIAQAARYMHGGTLTTNSNGYYQIYAEFGAEYQQLGACSSCAGNVGASTLSRIIRKTTGGAAIPTVNVVGSGATTVDY